MSFRTRYGNYEFLVTSFVLKNSPASFTKLIKRVFPYYLDLFVIVFIDEVFVYSNNEDEHMNHLGYY